MPKIVVSSNAKQVSANISVKPKRLDSGLTRALTKAGLLVERHSKIAAPVDTGRLRSSIQTEIGRFTATIFPSVKYAIFVHQGTRFMRGRPFMKIGEAAARRQINAIFKKEVGNALK